MLPGSPQLRRLLAANDLWHTTQVVLKGLIIRRMCNNICFMDGWMNEDLRCDCASEIKRKLTSDVFSLRKRAVTIFHEYLTFRWGSAATCDARSHEAQELFRVNAHQLPPISRAVTLGRREPISLYRWHGSHIRKSRNKEKDKRIFYLNCERVFPSDVDRSQRAKKRCIPSALHNTTCQAQTTPYLSQLPDSVSTHVLTIYSFISFARLGFCPPHVHCALTIPSGTIKAFPFVVRGAKYGGHGQK